MQPQPRIPTYSEINDFLASIPSPYRSDDPDFYCLRLKENESAMNNYKPPFRKDFYFMALVSNAGKTRITYDNTSAGEISSFLVFQAPGLLYSFNRDDSARGYLIYFKKDCFSFFKPDFENEFPFFSVLNTNFFKLNKQKFCEFSPDFEGVFKAYESEKGPGHRSSALLLLALLYRLKGFAVAHGQWETGFTTPQHLLLDKFTRLVNNYYLDKRTIEEYADLLNVSPGHLSQSIKKASGKNAHAFITERVMTEARSFLQFTDLDVAEIAYQLNFSDPANFGKAFKKETGLTPLEFRTSKQK
jgi:AraC family transcriptional activator of pobA